MMRRTLARGGIVLVLAMTGTLAGCTNYYSGGPGPGGPGRGQPYMVNALSALQAARQQLEQAAPDKGGHRVQAIQLVDQAITQVEMGMQFAEGE